MVTFAIGALATGCSSAGVAPGLEAPAEGSRERRIIQSASSGVEVADLATGVANVQAIVAAKGGRISSSKIGETSATLLARVPAAHLSATLDELARLGEEKWRTTSSEDVTESYSDLEAEIENLRALRDRLRRLLDRATTVEEVLQVERELTRVQTRLDSLTARRTRMDSDVQLSALTVSLSVKPPRRILGPLGLLYEGTRWLVQKLFVISP